MTNVVILVHGTWGRSENAWYQLSNDPESFTHKLTEALKADGMVDPILFPYEWEHKNNHLQRVRGAEGLANRIIDLRRTYPDAKFHFIGHSHGGNVVLKAIEIYIRDLKNIARAPFRTKDNTEQYKGTEYKWTEIINTCNAVFERYDLRDGNKLMSEDAELAKLVAELLQMTKFIEIAKKSMFFRLFGAFSFDRKDAYSLLDNILDHLFSHEEHHRIVTIVTLGTPFYFKNWRISQLSHIVDQVIEQTSLMVIRFVKRRRGGFTVRAVDTNIYIDVSKINNFVKHLGKRKLCRTLIVHANYLDEPYLGFSSFPILDPVVKDTLGKLRELRLWNFQWEQNPTGVFVNSTPAKLRLLVKNIINLVMNIILSSFYMIRRFLLNPIVNWYLNRKFSQTAKTLALGLPEEEFNQSSIEVKNVSDFQFFDTYQFDSSNYMTELSINTKQELNRYSFLWDDGELEKRIRTADLSDLAGYIFGEQPTKDQQKLMFALQERMREFFGVTGFRHSMYYENEKVMDVICNFLTGKNVSGIHRVNSDFDKDS